MKLVIGAGERRVEGAVHHDVLDLPGIDIVCEFWKLHKYVDPDSCDEIHMTHVLEHFPMKKTIRVLELVHSLLASTGRLYLEVPNLEWQARELIRNPSNKQIVEYAYGGQKDKWDFHFNGFTPDILVDDLITTGFKVEELIPNSSIECWCSR